MCDITVESPHFLFHGTKVATNEIKSESAFKCQCTVATTISYPISNSFIHTTLTTKVTSNRSFYYLSWVALGTMQNCTYTADAEWCVVWKTALFSRVYPISITAAWCYGTDEGRYQPTCIYAHHLHGSQSSEHSLQYSDQQTTLRRGADGRW